ncbi:SPFH domain / Band 7 family [Novymonas esmeraldas]|uniref:SPFH domain / Band 7 family n=1 Tax=Novymonas esmeraldas TaxID=1808958 RepID=A0AAW0F0C7_9TRYP
MGSCPSVSQSEVGIVETCGRYSHTADPGIHCLWCGSYLVRNITLRLQEYELKVQSKTKDNVFVILSLIIQYQVAPDKVAEVYYSCDSSVECMRDYVLNSIRAKVPLYKLEALYVERGTISQQLKDEVDAVINTYGIEIVSALIADIDPGTEITQAMNDVQKFQRLRVASVDAAETEKLKRVRAAEARCEARRLSGEGLAESRKAIVAGLMQSIGDVQDEVRDLTADDATTMLLMNQYYDTLEAIAGNSRSSVMMLESNGGLERVAAQLRQGVTQSMR